MQREGVLLSWRRVVKLKASLNDGKSRVARPYDVDITELKSQACDGESSLAKNIFSPPKELTVNKQKWGSSSCIMQITAGSFVVREKGHDRIAGKMR